MWEEDLEDLARRKFAWLAGTVVVVAIAGGGWYWYSKRTQVAAPEPCEDLLALDEALNRLAAKDPRKAELVKLRHFAGLTVPEAAAALGISTTTANRYWRYARALLHQAITGGAAAEPGAPPGAGKNPESVE